MPKTYLHGTNFGFGFWREFQIKLWGQGYENENFICKTHFYISFNGLNSQIFIFNLKNQKISSTSISKLKEKKKDF